MSRPISPVVVVGAGRSGTNLLRDIACLFEGHDTWPCDEINYIWRYGNRNVTTDELQPNDARPEVVRFIRNAFGRQHRRQSGGVVIEKTCANSLRLGFVNEVFPGARFLYIERDGRDVVTSAMERWTAAMEIPYLIRKARFVPRRDLPHYASRYLGTRLHRIRSGENRLQWWGPRIAGFERLAATASLAEICALQWRRCVDLSNDYLSTLAPSRVHRVRYEDIVTDVGAEVERLATYLGTMAPPSSKLPTIRTASVGRWQETLSEDERVSVERIVGPIA